MAFDTTMNEMSLNADVKVSKEIDTEALQAEIKENYGDTFTPKYINILE